MYHELSETVPETVAVKMTCRGATPSLALALTLTEMSVSSGGVGAGGVPGVEGGLVEGSSDSEGGLLDAESHAAKPPKISENAKPSITACFMLPPWGIKVHHYAEIQRRRIQYPKFYECTVTRARRKR